MKRSLTFLFGIGFAILLPAVLSAETAYTRKDVNLRAGPSREYPLVAIIPYGVPVEVAGCVDDWTWCDAIAGDDRGWVYAGNLEFPYEGRRVVVLDNGPIIGFPIVTFSFGPYWDTYYRSRPWYSRRSYWSHRPPPPRWVGRPRSTVVRPGGHRPSGPIVRPGPRPRPQAPQPGVGRRAAPRPQPQPRPNVARPPAPRPEVARPPQQPARPAPVKPESKRGRPEGRGPGGA